MALRVVTSYLKEAFNTPQELFDQAFDYLADKDFDTMVGIGLSGSLIVPVLAREFSCDFAIVRKDPTSSHSGSSVEGVIGDKWIFVDDLVDSGDTFYKVKNAIKSVCAPDEWNHPDGHETTFMGTYLYHSRRWYPVDHNFRQPWSCGCERCAGMNTINW